MASADTLISWLAPGGWGPASNFATPDEIATTLIPCWDFDDATDETLYLAGRMPGQYDGSTALDVILGWKFTTYVGSQTCDWEVSFYRIADSTDTAEAFTFAAAQTLTPTEADSTGELDYAVIPFSNAQADGIQPNEFFVLRVKRDASGGTASPGDAELVFVDIEIQ